MFLKGPGKPTTLKKTVYLIAATVLGMMLSFLAHAFIEINYLRSALSHGQTVSFYNGCALPPVINYGLWLVGAAGGFMLGTYWWRWVYVDRIWAKRRGNDKKSS